MRRPPLIIRLLRRWHKQAGLAAAGFFLYLALTGLTMNHGATIGLDKVNVGMPWLMRWYGLKARLPAEGFRDNGVLFVAGEDAWVLSGKPLKPGHGLPLGFVRYGDQLWLATASELSIYQPDGQLIDRITADLLPAQPLRHLGILGGQIVIDTGRGGYTSADGIAWKPLGANAPVITWSHPQPLSEAEQQALAPLFAPSLPLLRVVADVHSGHVFGRYGALVTDAMAFALLLLAVSGVWLHFHRPRGRPHRERQGPQPSRQPPSAGP